MVDGDGSKLVDDNGCSLHGRIGQDVVQRDCVARAKKAGQACDRHGILETSHVILRGAGWVAPPLEQAANHDAGIPWVRVWGERLALHQPGKPCDQLPTIAAFIVFTL